MKKTVLFLFVLTLLSCCPAFADSAEPGLLRTAILYDISTMDVTETTDDYLIPLNVFDRLFETRPGSGSSEIVKSLVTDYAIRSDGLTYDFTLRDDVVFSNGSALTASDVQFSFERLLKAAKKNTEIPLEILGAEAVMNGEADSLEGFSISGRAFCAGHVHCGCGDHDKRLRQRTGGNDWFRSLYRDGLDKQRSLHPGI